MAKPEIRLKGFKGEWESYLLSTISERYDNLRIPVKESCRKKGKIPYYGANGIQDYVDGFTHDGEYILIAEDGANDLTEYPVQYVNGKVWVNNHAHVICGNSKALTLFLKYAISCANVKSILVGGTRAKLTADAMMKLELLIPTKDEQVALADYFKSLDSMIQGVTKKIASLKQMKQACLVSMFPQAGETKPRVRFKGFKGEWGKDKAGNLFMTFNERNRPDLPVLSANQDIRGMAPRTDTGYNISHNKANEVTYKVVKPGQYVIHLRSFQGGFAHSSVEGITSPAYTVFGFKDAERHDDYFWKIIFMSKEFIKSLETITYGIRDGRSISFSEFVDMNFYFPSKEEQTKIASYFRSLDKQISLQEQRLEKLKQIKAACLDKMFV